MLAGLVSPIDTVVGKGTVGIYRVRQGVGICRVRQGMEAY
jgi:hypothetical protein